MNRPGDTIGQDAIGGGRLRRGLLTVSALALLSGCGWFDSDTPVGNARPGADRQAPIMSTLPPPASGQHDAGIVATDPAATAQIGSIIPAKGGQKAQKEEIEKETAERNAKEREERERREAEERDAKAAEEQEPETAKPLTPAGALPGMPAAAVRGNPETGDTTPGEVRPGGTQPTASPGPPATTAPPPAPVTTAPIAPPTAPAPVPAPAPNPAPAAEPPATPPKT